MPAWHRLSIGDAAQRLACDARGLAAAEAQRRLARFGPNQLQPARRVSAGAILVAQLKNVLTLILLAAAAFSLFTAHRLEAVAILVIVLLAVLLGFIQEYRAERAIEALRSTAAPTAKVLRDGQTATIPARDVVPGDVILLAAGDKIPADARLLAAASLAADEAALTGESTPVEKQTAPLAEENLPLGDRTNLVFAGTIATRGRGRGLVVATGQETQFGAIATLLESVDAGRTPLQKNLDVVGRRLAVAGLAVVAAIVALGLLRGQPWLEVLIFGIALAVAVVPEALPAVVTISLAIGVQRMARRNALVRRLPAVETLGSTSVICSDKTGTLTRDQMTVRRLAVADQRYDVTGAGYEPAGEFHQGGQAVAPPERVQALLRAAALCSDAELAPPQADGGGWQIKGDPTEAALVVAAAKAGWRKEQLESESPRIDEIPFTAETKRMTTVHRTPQGTVAFAKGAPEAILHICTYVQYSDGPRELGDAGRQAWLDEAQQMAAGALRVLAIAERRDADRAHADEGLTLLGLVGMLDPPRSGARDAVAACKRAGIRPIMITGDHLTTAAAIARELGILDGGEAIAGAELEALDDDEYRRRVGNIQVYARVSPQHKLRVVRMLQEQGHVAAMTGDGVNDAPALKQADIGIAMGITGTDVTKEAAAMTLTDDNFASIVAAVEEGRVVYGNIKKYLMYLLSSNIGEIGLMASAAAFGWPLPLTAVQLLYVNLATDGWPALALAVDPPESDVMRHPPRDPRRGIFTPQVVLLTIVGGLWSAAINAALFAWALQSGRPVEEAMTMTFVSLVLIQFFKAYNFRSDHLSVLHRPLANRWLNLAVAWEVLLLLLVVYLPLLQTPFRTVALTAADWAIIGAASLTVSPVLELLKWRARRARASRYAATT